MHWWQGAFTSKAQSDDDNIILDGGGESRYSLRSSFFSSRRSRLLARARKLRQVTENDVIDVWRSPGFFTSCATGRSSMEAAEPQPLPLPELQVLLQRDPKFVSSSSVPLPSPDRFRIPRGFDDKERERDRETNESLFNGADGYNVHRRVVASDARTNAEHSEPRSSRKSSQKKNSKEKPHKTYAINIPSSCPTSPYSSPAQSPPVSDMWATQYMVPPGVFQVWSAPEMPPHSDVNSSLGFYYQMPYEKTTSCVDDSPPQSPTKISSDIPTRWESNAQATVHPLPLPPGAGPSSQTTPISPVGSKSDSSASLPSQGDILGAKIPSQPSPVPPVGSKPEVKPIKSQWQKGKLIGRGTFGSVYVASNRETGALCAMKVVEILPDDSKYAENMRQLEQEIKVLSRLKHPNIVQYFGSEIVGDKFYIYLEYVHPGSINRFIHDHCGAITESVVRNFTRHILSGLAYLHSKKTIHRDIKGANLLVDAYGVVKLADFGMAKHLSGQAGHLSLKGSPYWMAPELLQSSMQTDSSSTVALAVDIWSLGCTIIEMMNGKPPWSEYEGAAALFKVLQETPPIPETLSAEGKDFLECCFRRNPADRPTASKLLDHPFVSYPHQPRKDIRLNDNMQVLRERPSHKNEQLPESFNTQIKKEKRGNNETSRRKHLQTPRLAVGPLPSPRSTLDPLPNLSPPPISKR